MATIRTSCNPAQLRWAREEAGLTIEQAAQAIGTSSDLLDLAEKGDHSLTLNQLRQASKQYNFPYGYFYLKNHLESKKSPPVPDFRIDPSFQHKEHFKLNLILKKIRDRRETFIDLISDLDREQTSFLTLSTLSSNQNIGVSIRERLNVTDKDVASLSFDSAYSFWKSKIEGDGVLVYESDQIPDETGVIGAALFYENYPIILIKRGSSVRERKLFTLLHEYAHLLLGQSAINDSESMTVESDFTDAYSIEHKCNLLAAEILVPRSKLNKDSYISLSPIDMMVLMAREFKVTFSTALVCLKNNKFISHSDFVELMKQRKSEHERKQPRQDQAHIPRETLMKLDLGKPMFRAVFDSYSNGYLSMLDASSLLGLRVNKIDKLLKG